MFEADNNKIRGLRDCRKNVRQEGRLEKGWGYAFFLSDEGSLHFLGECGRVFSDWTFSPQKACYLSLSCSSSHLHFTLHLNRKPDYGKGKCVRKSVKVSYIVKLAPLGKKEKKKRKKKYSLKRTHHFFYFTYIVQFGGCFHPINISVITLCVHFQLITLFFIFMYHSYFFKILWRECWNVSLSQGGGSKWNIDNPGPSPAWLMLCFLKKWNITLSLPPQPNDFYTAPH